MAIDPLRHRAVVRELVPHRDECGTGLFSLAYWAAPASTAWCGAGLCSAAPHHAVRAGAAQLRVTYWTVQLSSGELNSFPSEEYGIE